ncbi:MAG: short-chain dehydrogenase/reductase [Myxococcaceae bacterium]|nr:short-chain dehydrogenase/reductase [Myxococcaceae bacterium]
MNLEGKTVLISGGTSGIGYELAAQLLRRGSTVLVTGRRREALEAAARKLPGLVTFQCDVRDPSAIATLRSEVLSSFPQLSVLINNAGVMNKINLHTIGEQDDETMEEIDTNLSGTVRMVLHFLAHLKAQQHAAIVNVSSGLAFNPYPIAPIYGATKAAIHSFTQSLRVQLKHTRVQVFELAPPAVDTPLNNKFVEYLKDTPLMNTATFVNQALIGLEKDRLEIRVGFANVSKFLSRLAPGLLLRVLSKPVDLMLDETRRLGQ